MIGFRETIPDLIKLPTPDVLATPNYEQIVSDNVAILQQLKPDYDWLESDDYMLLAEAFAYRELHLRQEFNNRLRASLLLTAKGNDLDARAIDYGVERLDGEDDEAFRVRILESLARFSTAGSRESYEYHAKSVSAEIDDVKAVSPDAGEVVIYVASFNDAVSDELIAQVADQINDTKVRSITDHVVVLEATDRVVNIEIDVFLADMSRSGEIESVIKQRFAKPLKIHQPITVFDMITACDVSGVHDALPTTQAMIPAVGERLVIGEINLQFKQAVIEV